MKHDCCSLCVFLAVYDHAVAHKKNEQKICIFHGERVLQSLQLFEILGQIQSLVRISLQSHDDFVMIMLGFKNERQRL